METQYDATYIRILLEILYKDDLKTLLHRSFSGKTKKNSMPTAACLDDISLSQTEPFKAISPRKKCDIFCLFNRRVRHANTSKQDQFDRLRSANIARLIGAGIVNIRKKL